MSSFFKSSGSVDTGTLPQSGSDVASNTEANTAITSFFKTAGANSTDEATISASVTAAALSEANAATSESNAANSAASALQSRNTATSAIATVTAARDLTLDYRNTASDHKDAAASSALDASSSATAASDDADDAELARQNAVAAQNDAEQAEQDAQTAQAAAELAETNAETAQAASEGARDTAQNHRDDAQKLATNAEDSQFTLSDTTTTGYSALHYNAKALAAKTAAETAQGHAETAEQNAETSETNAADSETNAAGSASSASSSAGTATTKAGEASDSAADAQKLAINAEDSQFTLSDTTTTGYSALHYSAKASASATAASNSASAASDSEGEASTSEQNASSSASTASTKAGEASDSAADAQKLAITAEDTSFTLSDNSTTGYSALHYNAKASASATAAASSASAASTSEGLAEGHKDDAETAASNASSAQSAAESARDSALAAYDNFDDRYLGVKSSAPSVDNDGDALVAGALYFDSTGQKMQLYSGSAWVDAYVQGGDVVFKSQSNTGITGTLEFVGGVSYDPSSGTAGNDTSTTAAIALSDNMSIVKPVQGYIRNLFKTTSSHDIVIGNEINTSFQNNVNIYSSNTGHINLYDGHQRVFSTTANGAEIQANNTGVGLEIDKDNTSGWFFRAMYNGTSAPNRPYGLKPPASDSTTDPFTWETSNAHAFSTDGSQRMRIQDSGVVVTGLLAATTKSFDIEHPTKPGMRLRYGVLEGPENGVYVRGRLTSFSTIQLPEHWKGLVHEDNITVQLTPIGRKQDLWVEHVDLERVEICKENIDCYYVVWAERKDVPKLEVEYAPEV